MFSSSQAEQRFTNAVEHVAFRQPFNAPRLAANYADLSQQKQKEFFIEWLEHHSTTTLHEAVTQATDAEFNAIYMALWATVEGAYNQAVSDIETEAHFNNGPKFEH